MAKNKKWKKVSEAVFAALMDLGETDARFEQFLHWALEGAREWHNDLAKEVKTTSLSMTPHKSIVLPDDYVDWVKVGIKCGNVIKTFTHDHNISLEHDCEDGKKTANKDCENVNLWDLEVTGNSYLFHNYQGADNGVDTPIYGLAYKDNGLGYFTEHRNTGEIQFRSIVPSNSKIYLEYISDGWDPNEETLINPLAFQLIVKYIHWKNKLHNPNIPRSHVQEAKDEYWEEFSRVSWRMFDLTVEDVQEIAREAFVATVQN